MQSHAAVDDSVLEILLAIQQGTARIAKLVDGAAVANHAHVMQQHAFVHGIDVDGDLRAVFDRLQADHALHDALVVFGRGREPQLVIDQ